MWANQLTRQQSLWCKNIIENSSGRSTELISLRPSVQIRCANRKRRQGCNRNNEWKRDINNSIIYYFHFAFPANCCAAPKKHSFLSQLPSSVRLLIDSVVLPPPKKVYQQYLPDSPSFITSSLFLCLYTVRVHSWRSSSLSKLSAPSHSSKWRSVQLLHTQSLL